MYVDKFFRTAVNQSGLSVVNPVFSILGVPAKEDSLLKFAKENHITYLILYDLHYVFGNATFENYLCNFITKAKTQYCIEEIGMASSCSSLFDNISSMSASASISFTDPKYSDYSPQAQNDLAIVEQPVDIDDTSFYIAEVTKLAMRAASFNDMCSSKIDVLVSEYEFWNATVDDCQGDLPTKDQKYLRYQTLITNMDNVRDNYNSTHTGHQVYVETYLGYLNQNTAYTHQVIANWIDGVNANGKRRVDRINTHYYGADPTRLYSRTAAGQNNSGYYATRFLDFCQSSTNNQTNLHPIFSSESVPWGNGVNYLGSWFYQNVNNNIFTAEKKFYNDWYDDATNYNPSTVGSPSLGTMVQPGGVMWFTASQLWGHVDRPVLFTSNSPVCVPTGQNGNFQFQYIGPIEQGDSYKFYLTNPDNMTVRCGSNMSIPWPVYNAATQTSIDLNATLGGCTLPAGDYDAHLELTYSSGCEPYIAPIVRVSIVNSGKIVALTPTTVCQNNPVYLQASSSGGTITYAWYDGATAISGATSSTYAPDANSTGAHSYSCLITSSVSGCSANRSNIIPVTINTYPTATVSTLSTTSCSVSLQASPTGATYVWNDGSTGSTYTTSFTGVYSCAVTKNGCTGLSNKYTVSSINGSGNATPAVTISSNKGNSICSQTPVVFTATPVNGGSAPVYQWKKNGVNVGINSNTYSLTNLVNNDVITCVMTSNLPCTSPTTATSNAITMSVTALVTPGVTISSNTGTSICAATNVSYTAAPVNGGTNPYYQWMKNGTYVGINANTYSDNGLANNDTIKCIMTSTATCPSLSSDTSNKIVMSVSSYVTPSVSISASTGNTICSGTSVTFTATPVNGGTTPTYQWKKNGTVVGTNSSIYTTGTLANGDVVICSMTSGLLCVNPATVTSNSVTMTVNTTVTPSISISSSQGNSICTGTSVTFTATPVNGGSTPVYQWKKNGTTVGTNSVTYVSTVLMNNDVITCNMTSNAICASVSSVTSNAITMTVNTPVTSSVSISSGAGNSICSGTNVTYTATPVNGGSTPVYQWKKNGTNVGTNSTTYSISTLANNDVISCNMTSNAACVTPTTATSNSITMLVSPVVTPSVSISSNIGTTICSGSTVILTANPVNGGAPPNFQWRVNGGNVGLNSSTLTTTALSNNDVVTCQMTSTANCASPTTVNSNSLTMNIIPTLTPSVSIATNTGNSVCAGTSVTFTASPVNGGAAPVYQWKKNGLGVGISLNTYTDNSISDNDQVNCTMVANMECLTTTIANSNTITMDVNQHVNASVIINPDMGTSICGGTPVTFTAQPFNGGTTPVFQWKKNGNNVGTNSSVYSTGSYLNNDIVTCVMTSSESCVNTNPVTSNAVIMSVIPCVDLNLRVFIQGYYLGGSKMIAVINPVDHPTICDTIKVELHDPNPPYNIAYLSLDTIDINGYGKFRFSSSVLNQNYFVVVKHRNSLETWSDSPVFFNSSSVNFDFTSSSNHAYGTNLADLGDGNFAMWSGDVTDGITPGLQDGIINEYDQHEMEHALNNFYSGYQVTDLTGDGIVESADFALAEHNYVTLITLSRP